MAKKSGLVGVDGGLLNVSASTAYSVPSVVGAAPVGSQVLVEILHPQELLGTTITISDKTDVKVPLQGYVRAVGPAVKLEDWGFKVGDRVLISGSGVMVPNHDDLHRDRFFMEPHSIKGVLAESK
jgi:co-chaperonin GroES (HSP10)